MLKLSKILDIKKFDIALKFSHFKIRKNGHSVNLIAVIVLNDLGNQGNQG